MNLTKNYVVYVVLVIFIPIAFAVGYYVNSLFEEPVTIPEQIIKERIQPTEVQHKPDFSSMEESLNKLLEEREGTWGIVVGDIKEGGIYELNGNRVFHAASISKVVTAVAILQQIEDGQEDFERVFKEKTIQDHLFLMINKSDNESWDALNKTAGLRYMQTMAENFGMENFDVFENQMSPIDTFTILDYLQDGKILSKKNREFLLESMTDTIFEDRIPSGVDAGTTVQHKTGTYEQWVHDAGIVRNGRRPYIIVVFGEGAVKEDAILTIGEISKTVFDFYQEL